MNFLPIVKSSLVATLFSFSIQSGSFADAWDYKPNKLEARIKISEKDYFVLSCYKPEDSNVVGKIEGVNYFRAFISGDNVKFGQTWDESIHGQLFMSERFLRMFLNDQPVKFSFQYKQGKKQRFRNTDKIEVAGTIALVAKMSLDCAKAPKPVIWAHGDTCPAEIPLLNSKSAVQFLRDNKIQSGKLVFSPVSKASDGTWCKRNSAFYFRGTEPRSIYAFDALPFKDRQDLFREFGCAIKKLCPQMQTVSYTQLDDYGVKFFFAKGAVVSNFVPLGDEEFARTQQTSTSNCDVLASHPNDPLKPYGVNGVLEADLEAEKAVLACRAELAKTPDEPRIHFQLGRSLLLLGQHNEAFEAFRKAADLNYPMGMTYLGHSYANAWGTKEDFRQANIYWRKGDSLGAGGGDARAIETAVAKATNSEVRILCDRLDLECKEKQEFQSFLRELPNDTLRDAYRLFFDIHSDLRPIYVAFYLRDFPALDRIKSGLYAEARKEGGGLDLVTQIFPGLKPQLDESVEQGRYSPLIAQYALSKTKIIGLCGEIGQEFEVTRTVRNSWRNAYGVEVFSSTEKRPSIFFSVPRRFASFINESETTGEWLVYGERVQRFVREAGGCQSKVLKQLEDGMMAYQNWKPR